MAERVDVFIAGTGFGGSIAAWRLAELYRAAGRGPEGDRRARARPALRAHRLQAVDGRRPPVGGLRPRSRATGMQVVTANAVGGGSNLYLAASLALAARDLRAPRPPARRRARPADVAGGDLARARSTRYYARAERGLRVRPPDVEPGVEVRRAVGGDAARGRATPATACRWRSPRALRRREVVPHRLHLRRQELADHQLPRRGRAAGVQVRPLHRGAVGAPVLGAAVPLRRHGRRARPRPEQPSGPSRSSARSLILADRRDGRRADPDALAATTCRRCRASVGQHLGFNGDHVAAIEYDPKKVRDGARPAGLRRSSTRASRSRR